MKQTISGKGLHSLMVANRKSLRDSAKELGISKEELQSYFEYDEFEIPFIENIRNKLNLRNVVDIPNAVTPSALDLIEHLEASLKLQKEIIDLKQKRIDENQRVLIEQLDKMKDLYVIIGKQLRKEFIQNDMEENYQYIRKLLIDLRGHCF